MKYAITKEVEKQTSKNYPNSVMYLITKEYNGYELGIENNDKKLFLINLNKRQVVFLDKLKEYESLFFDPLLKEYIEKYKPILLKEFNKFHSTKIQKKGCV